jgi:hypothetical protein
MPSGKGGMNAALVNWKVGPRQTKHPDVSQPLVVPIQAKALDGGSDRGLEGNWRAGTIQTGVRGHCDPVRAEELPFPICDDDVRFGIASVDGKEEGRLTATAG